MKLFRRGARVLTPLLVSLGSGALFLELAYRIQLLDFYEPELVAYNRAADLVEGAKRRKTGLVLGDSFGAGLSESYPARLRDALPGFRVINASVSGIGSIEARLVAPRLFSRFRPDVLVYQIYVGNDLFDIRHPSDLAASGAIRWAYWNVANHLRSIEFLNYRLGQNAALHGLVGRLRGEAAATPEAAPPALAPDELPSHRERMIYAADPALLDETVFLKGRRRDDFRRLVENVRAIVRHCDPGSCRAVVLVVPHKVQVTEAYARQYERIGARYADAEAMRTVDYPFVEELERSLADERHVVVSNPLGALQEAEARGARLFFANDEHLNEHGQALLAGWVAEAIRGPVPPGGAGAGGG
jgi:hypothetical protein